MSILNPVKIAEEIEKSYRLYLKTSFYFRDPELRNSFDEALQSGRLIKGPYLEGTPVFKRGKNPKELVQDLGYQFDEGFLQAINGERRPLYQHQEEAIRLVSQGNNIVVTTGTGSGKTESFLFPILFHLYQEFLQNELRPGTRALILYPMNALANDQRERLGEISSKLKKYGSPFQFTFGQYTGDTPEDENDIERNADDYLKNRLPGELVFRSEMRNSPPHILLTNYSMLEYLLIRPNDSPLFDNGLAKGWRFFVIDEAHQYRGAKGIEMGMLLRRLKQRLKEGGRDQPFQCIATSATLTNGAKERKYVANFATELFGEPFDESGVIFGTIEPVNSHSEYTLSFNDYKLLKEALDSSSVEKLSKFQHHINGMEVTEVFKITGTILKNDSRSIYLRQLVTEEPKNVSEIANVIFSDLTEDQRITALALLVEILLKSEDPVSKAPLISARYHFFLRSLEGAFISYYPKSQILLDRSASNEGGKFFEVAICRECGQHYLVGRIFGGKLEEAVRDPGDPDFGAVFFRPVNLNDVEDEEDEENPRQKQQLYRLCLECGTIYPVITNKAETTKQMLCGHNLNILVEQQEESEERVDQIPRCSSCNYSAPDPVREIIHGTDGPHVVIVTSLYQQLCSQLPLEYRKVLAFADSRQQAAFFAWYLEASYRDILNRSLLYKTINELSAFSEQGLSLKEIEKGLREHYLKSEIMSPSAGELELKTETWKSIFRELLTDETRISLEGVGLIKWSIKWPKEFEIPKELLNSPWSLTEQEAKDLILILLETFRSDKAIELITDGGVRLSWSDLNIQGIQHNVLYSEVGQLNKVQRRWSGKNGKRAQFLMKILLRQGFNKEEAENEVQAILRLLWEKLKFGDEYSGQFLLYNENGYRFDPNWFRVKSLSGEDMVYICETCGRIQPVSVYNICTRHRCPGIVKPVQVKFLEEDHYQKLYKSNLPIQLRVEEHTAQIERDKANSFQRAFKEGKIQVLSCSTTFELGVDLGDLNVVFLRNVPPESFNYAQRVGRTGRRSGYPGFAITYCRRSAHDFYHFTEPQRMLKGSIRAPKLSLQNEKIILRHITATMFSYFFRDPRYSQRFNNVGAFLDNFESPKAVLDFRQFLTDNQATLETSLKEIVPKSEWEKIGLDSNLWISKITDKDSRFSLVEMEIASDFRSILAVERKAAETKNYKKADWAHRRQETIKEEQTLNFLSRKAVIPKYGFPVDLVSLDTHSIQQTSKSQEVELQRDLALAISEFAPTSRLVANKKEWVSYGLKRVPEREWDRWNYCLQHNKFIKKEKKEETESLKCCKHMKEFIIPKFGFVTNQERAQEPKGRPTRLFSTRPYFVGLMSDTPEQLDFGPVQVSKASLGRMAIVCEGRNGSQFFICSVCGAGFCNRQGKHKNPYGEDCTGTLEKVSLGHEFITDVVSLNFRMNLVEFDLKPYWLAYSLASALVEGAAEVLEVPSTDLNVTVINDVGYPIILYDAVPGGAGLVARLEEKEILNEVLQTAYNRVNGDCGCDYETSCYGCLRSYRNQFAHQNLQRGPVKEYLEELLKGF